MYIFINILIIVVIIFYTVLTLVKFFKRSKGSCKSNCHCDTTSHKKHLKP